MRCRKIITLSYRIITFSLLILILSSINLINVSALSYSGNINVNFTFNPTISVNISNNLVIPSLTPGTTESSNTVDINVSTNNVYGYNLYATVGNEVYDNTNLNYQNNDANATTTANAATTNTASTNAFTSISPTASLSDLDTDNTWGYSYSLDNRSSWSNYSGLPFYTSNNPTRLKRTTEPSSDTINFKIGAKASSTQPSGIYSNVVNFIAITKQAPMSLAESYEAYYRKEGKTKLNGYYVMQDMNPEICDNAELVDTELQVIDNRDNKIYWIAKLRDDHCWMTQNLDLDLISDPQADSYVALTSENTDLNDTVHSAYQNGYTVDENGVITWIPTNTTTNFTGTSMDNWINSTRVPSSASKTDDTNTGHYIYGNWYNWSAAIASNNSSSFNTSTYDNPANNPKNSICPKGWRLPIITAYSTDRTGDNDFNNLNYYYNNGSTSTNAGLTKGPAYFRNASYAPYLTYMGSMMYYWSSSTILSEYTVGPVAMLNSWGSAPVYRKQGTSSGYSIRCLAR